MMWILIWLLTPNYVQADVFKINQEGINNEQLQKAIDKDSRGLYFKNSIDANITSYNSAFNYKEARDLNLSITQNFPFSTNLDQQITKPFLKDQNVASLMNSVKTSSLINYAYNAPAELDLFKFYATMAQMRLAMFYAQANDLEKEFGGTLDVLRRQGLYDCLKQKKDTSDLPKRMMACSSQEKYFDALLESEGKSLEGRLDVLVEVFNRMNFRQKDVIDQIIEISPQWIILRGGYNLNAPHKRIGHVFASYRSYFIERMKEIIQGYKERKEVGEDDLFEFAEPGVILTEQYIRNLTMMDDDDAEILMSQWATHWARVKTMAQYELALEYFNRALIHPMIKQGFKAVVREDKEFVNNELRSFKAHMEGEEDYVVFMRSFLKESEKQKNALIDEARRLKEVDVVNHEGF